MRTLKRLPGAEIWDCAGVLEFVVGLAGRAKLILLYHNGEPQAHSTQVGVEVVERRLCGCSRKNNGAHCHGRDWDIRCSIRETSARRTPLRSVRGTPWEPNPGEVSTDLPEPILIILPDVEPAPLQTYYSDNPGTRNIYTRKIDLGRFGHTAGWPACEIHRAGSLMSGQEQSAECSKRLEDVMTTDASTSTRVQFEWRTRSARTRYPNVDAERLEEDATSAEADSVRRLARG